MEFEYNVLNDYIKIIDPIEKYGLRAECISKLKELGIKRIGEVIACSDTAISKFGNDAAWIKEAKEYFECVSGELEIWEVLWNISEYIEKDEDKYEAFAIVDEDNPFSILCAIVEKTLIGYLYDYKNNRRKDD